jgi:hypothetical protein
LYSRYTPLHFLAVRVHALTAFLHLRSEENENRKPLTERERARTFGSSKRLVESAKKAGEVLGATPKTPKPKGGRPTKGDVSKAAVAEALGVDRHTLQDAEQHVATAEAFPFMQGADLRQQ